MCYPVSRINRDWLIKVYGVRNGQKYNCLMGVSGIIALIGEPLFIRLYERAEKHAADVCHCKLRSGLKVSFYSH